jgi:hypothetical protein
VFFGPTSVAGSCCTTSCERSRGGTVIGIDLDGREIIIEG